MTTNAQARARMKVSNASPPLSFVPDDRSKLYTAQWADLRTLAVAREIVAELFGQPAERFFAVRYWNAAEESAGGQPVTTAKAEANVGASSPGGAPVTPGAITMRTNGMRKT